MESGTSSRVLGNGYAKNHAEHNGMERNGLRNRNDGSNTKKFEETLNNYINRISGGLSSTQKEEALNNNVSGMDGELSSTQNEETTSSNNSNFFRRVNEIFEPSERSIFVPVLTVRLFSIVVWTLSILYATYHVYLACEEHLNEWWRDPVMNPGSLSDILDRGKDASDFEWETFLYVYMTTLSFWYGLYAVMCRLVQPVLCEEWKYVSLGLSLAMFWYLLGFLPLVFILSQPFTYWLIAKTRSKLLAWTATMFFIYNLNMPITSFFIPTAPLGEYFFVITSAWNYARCISFCYDVWESNGDNPIGFKHLENITRYCFYLPLAISGPLVTYESYEKNIINRDFVALQTRNISKDFITFLKKMVKIGLIALMNELILHLLYFRALSLTPSVHRRLSLWAVCGTIYWLGQFFAMKYKVLYGVPTAIAELDGMEMPPLPTCPSYLHRYSTLWRDFDAGLYRFLVRYIYVPTLKFIKEHDRTHKIPNDVQKLMASFMTFVYIFVWHSLTFEVFIWTALNFLGITIERIGSAIKKKIDNKMHIDQIHWDFVIEPIVTVPLAAMSILNSSIFCGSMEAAASFASILWRRHQENWVYLFLYFFTHTAVTHRTWRHKLYRLFSKTRSD